MLFYGTLGDDLIAFCGRKQLSWQPVTRPREADGDRLKFKVTGFLANLVPTPRLIQIIYGELRPTFLTGHFLVELHHNQISQVNKLYILIVKQLQNAFIQHSTSIELWRYEYHAI